MVTYSRIGLESRGLDTTRGVTHGVLSLGARYTPHRARAQAGHAPVSPAGDSQLRKGHVTL